MPPQLTLFGEVLLNTPTGSYALRGGKGAALLVYLAYRGGWVRRESLLALLWPETPEKQARANLRQLLVKLRRSPHVGGLEVTASGVRWPVTTDVAAFRGALDEDDFTAAADLYAGPLLAEFDAAGSGDFGEWLAGERDGLFFAFRSAALARARALRQGGAFDELAVVLGRLLHHDPFDEDVLCERLGVLMETGRYRAALAAYETFRTRLRRELDAAPGKATRELAAQLRAAEADAPSGEAASTQPALPTPEPATPVPNRRATDIETGTPDAGIPALTLRASSAFVGCHRERDAVLQSLADPACRLLTLVGPGGVGKTRLALELSAVAEDFPDGVVMVPLEAVSDVQLLAPTLAACLGLSLDAPETPEHQVITHLSGRACLLILDNFEQLLEGKGFLLELLRRAPGVKLLLTTRERLGVSEEVPLELRGLSLVGEGAGPADAVTLFLHGARRVGVTLRREADLHHAADICVLVEGVPLALELTSAWLQFLTPAEVETELSAGLDLLVAPDADLPERHRNMRLVLAHSWARLEPDEQLTLARLAVFRGGFSYTAAKAVTGMSSGVLLALVYKSLLYRSAAGRFSLHELVRQYAAEQLQLTGEGAPHQVGAEYARYYLGLLGTLEMWSEGEADALAVLDAELNNLRAAWRWAVPSGRLPEFWVPNDVVIFFDRRMRYPEGLEFFEAVSGCFDPANPEHEETLANLRIDRAWLLFRLSRYAEAEALARDSLNASLSTKTRMKAYNTLGIIARQQGHYEVAVEHIEGALALARELDDMVRVAAYLNNLGGACIYLGDYERAEEVSKAALNLHRAADDVYGVVVTLIDLSNVYSAQSDFELAHKFLQEGLGLARGQEFNDLISLLLSNQAVALYGLTDLSQAKNTCHEALELMNDVGNAWDKVILLNLLGRIAVGQGEAKQARRYLTKGFLLAWRYKDTPSVLENMLILAELEISRHAYARAYKLLSAVAVHPVTQSMTRRKAERLLKEVEMHLSLETQDTTLLPLEQWVPEFFGLDANKMLETV